MNSFFILPVFQALFEELPPSPSTTKRSSHWSELLLYAKQLIGFFGIRRTKQRTMEPFNLLATTSLSLLTLLAKFSNGFQVRFPHMGVSLDKMARGIHLNV